MNLSKGTANFLGYFLETYFTTYDGNNGIPLHDEVSGFWIFGGEMQPVANLPGAYRTDYIVYANGALNASGTISATFPITDSNGNGVADFLERSMSGGAKFSGTIAREIPSTSLETFAGQITRAAGATTGSFTVTVQEEGFGPVSYGGQMFLLNGAGVLNYDRSRNTARITVTVSNADGTTTDYTTETAFQVVSANKVAFPASTFLGSGPEKVQANAFTLTRSGNRYLGNIEFADVGLSTSWRDYVLWRLEVRDANDMDENGIPDLSDVHIVAPDITAEPEDVTALAGESVQFSVVASGSEPLSYQWQRNEIDIAGATQRVYSIQNVSAQNAGNFAVVISNPAGNATSEIATLTVVTPPSILSGPESAEVGIGQYVEFVVTVGGSGPLFYQWQQDGTAIPGATHATYVIAEARLADAGKYSVVVSNSAGTIASSSAILLVHAAKPRLIVQVSTEGSMTLMIVTEDGLPISPERKEKLKILATTDLSRPLANWATYSLTELPLENGNIAFQDPEGAVFSGRFYTVIETP